MIKIYFCVNVVGLLMRIEIMLGQIFDYIGFDMVMVDNLLELSVLLVDRGYDVDSICKNMVVWNVFI